MMWEKDGLCAYVYMHMGLTFHHCFRLSHKTCYNANINCEGQYIRSVLIINALVWIRLSVLLLSLKKPWENKGIEWSKLEMMEGRGPTHRLLFIVLPQVGDVRGWPGKAAGSRSQDRCVHGYSFGMLFCCNLWKGWRGISLSIYKDLSF